MSSLLRVQWFFTGNSPGPFYVSARLVHNVMFIGVSTVRRIRFFAHVRFWKAIKCHGAVTTSPPGHGPRRKTTLTSLCALLPHPSDVCWCPGPTADLTLMFIDQRLYRFDAFFPRWMTTQKRQRRVRFAL